MSERVESSVGSKLKEAGRHSLVYGLGSIAQSAVQFLFIPILTAAFSSSAFGAFSLVQMVATVSGSIFFLGVTSALPRSYFDYPDERDRKSVFTTAFLLLVTGALLQLTIGLTCGPLLSKLILGTPEYSTAMAWALGGGALSFINYFLFAWLRFLRKSFISVLFSILTLGGSIGLSLWFLRLYPGNVTTPFLAITLTQGFILVVFLTAYGRQAFTCRILPREFTLLLSYGIPAVLSGFAGMLIEWSDRMFIERYVSLGAVGIYSAAFRLGSLVNVLLVAPFLQIWSPMMMEYRTHSNIEEFFTNIISYFFLIGGLILVMASLFIRNLLPFIIRSRGHEGLAPITLMVMLGYLIYAYSNICVAGLIYQRKMHIIACIFYGIAGVKLGMNALVIPAFGINGAAVTTLLVDILVPFWLYSVSKKYFPIRLDLPRLTMLALWVGLPFVYALFFEAFHPLSWLSKVPIAFVLLGAIYLFCTTPQEKAWVRRLFVVGSPC